MAIYRTAMGKAVDMAALAAKNEKVRAVGNMKVNARGDTIDSNGRVIKPVTSKVNEQYANTVGNRSSHVVKKTAKPAQQVPKPVVPEMELSSFERELEAELEDDVEIEKIKAQELKGKK